MSVLATLILSVFSLLSGVLIFLQAEQAVAEGQSGYGPDGYFSTFGEGAAGMPMRADGATATGARKILFGKSGLLPNAALSVDAAAVDTVDIDARYLLLGKGENPSEHRDPSSSALGLSASWTTPLNENEVLLWSAAEVTSAFKFAPNKDDGHSFDGGTSSNGVASYVSYAAQVSRELDSGIYYAEAERRQFATATALPGVCTAGKKGSCLESEASRSDSIGEYRVFPLSSGDMSEYFNSENGAFTGDDAKRQSTGHNGNLGSWSRSAHRSFRRYVTVLGTEGLVSHDYETAQYALRPALRLSLENLLLSASILDQSQNSADDMQLTFVDIDAESGLSKYHVNTWMASVSGEAGSRKLEVSGNQELGNDFGWKIVDPDTSRVLGSGRTSTGGSTALPEMAMWDESKDYDLYLWGQQDGSATNGWSNIATEPVKTTIKGWKVKIPPSYGISLTGQTSGALTAYRIGEYRDEVFDQTGALKSVRLDTPSGLGTVLKNAAETAGGSDVDAGNPIGWVASRWLGYPTDPLSDDVTSAFSPYAGQLQVFAQELAKHTDALGTSAGSLPAGTFPQPESTAMLPVSGPGLYLIVDSTQSSGGSLPIIVGTKVFNEAMEDVVEGGLVDFVDAGVKGKPRLGRAVLKTSITDIAKRVVNDAGLDGFDVGSEVEFEIALRVPDLSGVSSVAYDSYVFDVADVAEAGLTLPAASEVKVLVDVPSPDTDVTATGGLSIGVSGQMLTVNGLKAVFAEDAGGHVANKATLPAGSLMRLRYAAVLNTGASFSAPGGGGLAPNANTVTLTRSTSDGDTEQKTASATAYSFKVDVVKVDKDDTSTALGDAKFEVSRDGQALKFTQVSAGVYRLDAVGGTEVTTHADGTLTLLGVEARDLSFRETQAPDGYFTVSDFTVEVVPVWNADASEVTVASYRTGGTNLAYVSQDGRSVTVADPSKSLANLPYTGGVGILLLLIIGGVFLMVAVRPYYLSHRAEATANILM
jgi:fimbrial isopeptide formation D2 family protein